MQPYRRALSARFAVLALAVTGLVGPTPDALEAQGGRDRSAADTAAAARVRSYLHALTPFGFSGAVLAARDGKVILHEGFGRADDAAGVPFRPETPVLIGSLSKQVTAAAVLTLVESGDLRLDDSVGSHLPGASPEVGALTIHELLTHTGGLPYHPPSGFQVAGGRSTVVADLVTAPVDPAARGRYAYSNVGYGILAAVVEAAGGAPFHEYVRRALLEPAGMTRTRFMSERAGWPPGDSVRSYSGGADEGTLSAFPDMPGAVGAGTIVSTVGDLGRWMDALLGGRVLADSLRERMFTGHVQVQPTVSYGYGWNVAETVRGTTVIAHGGDLGGYNSELRHYPAEDLTLVVASNRRPAGPGFRMVVANGISLILAGQEPPMPPAVASEGTVDLHALEGAYRLPDGGEVRVEPGAPLLLGATSGTAGALLLGVPGQEALPTLDAPASAALAALRGGDVETLVKLAHPSVSAGFQASAEAWVRTVAEGGAATLEALGTVATAPGTGHTDFRFRRGGTWRVGRIGWAQGAIAGVDLDRDLPHARRFHPTPDGDLVAFDPLTGSTVRVSVVRGPDGVEALTLADTAGPVRAVRLPSQE